MADMKYGYTLNLSEDEMVFIRDVLNMVGGDPKNSRRKYADGILEAIYQSKDFATCGFATDVKHEHSYIMFTQKNGEI